MKVLVLQHIPVEHPGVFREYLKRDGCAVTTIELDRGDEIPALDEYEWMIVMGGPQDVWQESDYPWLVPEKAAIRRFVLELKRPFLGICLGHQLLAEAIGGTVGSSSIPEVGIMTVEKTTSGRHCELLDGLPDSFPVLQWHAAEVKHLPPTVKVIAHSKSCPVQAFSYGDHAYGLQFHIEITESTVNEWSAVPAYGTSLKSTLGADAGRRLHDLVELNRKAITLSAETLYHNFRRVSSKLAAASGVCGTCILEDVAFSQPPHRGTIPSIHWGNGVNTIRSASETS